MSIQTPTQTKTRIPSGEWRRLGLRCNLGVLFEVEGCNLGLGGNDDDDDDDELNSDDDEMKI